MDRLSRGNRVKRLQTKLAQSSTLSAEYLCGCVQHTHKICGCAHSMRRDAEGYFIKSVWCACILVNAKCMVCKKLPDTKNGRFLLFVIMCIVINSERINVILFTTIG